MPLRFFIQLIKSPVRTAVLSHVQVGRMPPAAKIESLKHGLEAELQQVGLDKLRRTIDQERLILVQLQDDRAKLRQRIHTEFVVPATSRFAAGSSVSSSFWQSTQEALHQKIITKNKYQQIEEKIDWLVARQELFKQIAPEQMKETRCSLT